jgi:hypothetical protein
MATTSTAERPVISGKGLLDLLKRNPNGIRTLIEEELTSEGNPMVYRWGTLKLMADGQVNCIMRGRYYMEQHVYGATMTVDALVDAISVKGIASAFPEAAADGLCVNSNRFAREIAALVANLGG